jgi:hypothetical protein
VEQVRTPPQVKSHKEAGELACESGDEKQWDACFEFDDKLFKTGQSVRGLSMLIQACEARKGNDLRV